MRLSSILSLPLVVTLSASAFAASNENPSIPSAAQAQNLPDSTPTLQVYSRETDVDVIVTDSQDRPVYGLTQADFTISEDGVPQHIRSFAEFGASSTAANSAAAHRLPPNVYTNYQATPTSGPVYIMLFDALSSSPSQVYYAQAQANAYFRAMPAGTQVAVFWLSSSGLHMLQGFTSDPDLLQRATNTNRIDFGGFDTRWTRYWITTHALDQLASYVSGIKGRKNLLWFSPRMPVDLMRDGGIGWGNLDMREAHNLMDMYELYTSEQIAVSPIDIHPVSRLGDTQLRMQAVAQGTGGIAYYETNDLTGAISRAVQDGSHVYSLTYVMPSHQNDGRFHKISVQIDRPGLHLVYRNGYNAEDPKPRPQETGTVLLKSSLDGSAPAATELLFDARVEPVKKALTQAATPAKDSAASKAPTTYDLLFDVPQNEIVFKQGPDGNHTSNVQFNADAYDIDGKLVTRFVQNVRLSFTDQQYRNFLTKPLQFHERVMLPVGQLTLRLGVLDSVADKAGTLEVSLFNWNDPSQDPSRYIPMLDGRGR